LRGLLVKVMKIKVPTKLSFLILGAEGIIFSLVLISFLFFCSPVQSSYTDFNLASGKVSVSILPARLNIPKIKVNANLESVGLTPDGAVGVAKGQSSAAWFSVGPRPGEIGNAVITGHYGVWKNGVPTVFNNLYKLRQGDKVYVKDKKGVTITFVVRRSKTYGQNDDVSEVFIASDDKSHLNLITCQGAWNKTTKSYPKRLVVFTDKLE